ncbi:phage tail protein [Erwinia sp. SLM-02]|uniref:phage tail protein n=1 Tax=Erwinia sp. SLM-02 TaxID=3020057 RepID=UPI00307FEB6A
MTANPFYAVTTVAGNEKIARAAVTGQPVEITSMAVGDGLGNLPRPEPEWKGLVNEVYRGTLNRLDITDSNASVIEAEMIIPPQAGGFWLREMAVFTDDGTCVAVGNMPETYKPLLAEGSGRFQVIRMQLRVSSTGAVELIADPSVVLATVKSVTDAENAAKDYTDETVGELDKTLKELINNSIEEAVETARRDFWEEENPVGTVRFYAKKVDPNTLYPWSTWIYTGENKSIRVGKADGSNVGQTSGSDTATIKRENLPAEKINVSGKAESAELNNVETTDAGSAEFNVYRFGADGRENSKGRFSLDDVEMGDVPVPVEIQPHKHTISLTVPERSVSGETEALGQGKTISVVEAHTLLMCWARTA